MLEGIGSTTEYDAQEIRTVAKISNNDANLLKIALAIVKATPLSYPQLMFINHYHYRIY